MTKQTKTVLKTYFETGDTPTQQEFYNFIESYPNLTDNSQLDGIDSAVVPVYPPTQGTAYGISAKYNFVPSVGTATAAVVLPSGSPGNGCFFTNNGSSTVTVYPAVDDKFELLAVDTGYLVYPGETFFFYCRSSGVWQWFTPDPQNGLAFEYSACLTQTSTNAPTDTVSRDTLPVSPVWSRFSTGIYRFTSAGFWTAGKTFLYGPGGDSVGNTWGLLASGSEDYIIVRSFNTGGSNADSLLSNTPFTFLLSRI